MGDRRRWGGRDRVALRLGRRRKQGASDHISFPHRKQTEQEVGWGYKATKPTPPSDGLPPTKLFLLKVSELLPNNTTLWGLGAQTHEPVGDISQPNPQTSWNLL